MEMPASDDALAALVAGNMPERMVIWAGILHKSRRVILAVQRGSGVLGFERAKSV